MTENNINIKDDGVHKKLPETHYERFIRHYSRLLRGDPLSLVDEIMAKHHKGTEPAIVDDLPYQQAAIVLFNMLLPEKEGENPFYNIDEISKMKPEFMTEFRSIMNSLVHLHRFRKSKMIFKLEESLTIQLLNTDVKKVDTHFVRSPFESIYLDVPHNHQLFIPSLGGDPKKVTGLYIFYADGLDLKDVKFAGSDNDDDGYCKAIKYNGVPATKVLRVLAVSEGEDKDFRQEATFYMSLFLSEGDVFPQVENAANNFMSRGQEHNKHYVKEIFTFCLNALFYLNNPKASFERIKPRLKTMKNKKRQAFKNSGLSNMEVISTGKAVRISSEIRESYRNGTLGNVKTASTSKWLVRGHYRNQACGEGMKEHRLIWIEPHEKGNGVNFATGRDYHVS